jgi:hypothetical protein
MIPPRSHEKQTPYQPQMELPPKSKDSDGCYGSILNVGEICNHCGLFFYFLFLPYDRIIGNIQNYKQLNATRDNYVHVENKRHFVINGLQ